MHHKINVMKKILSILAALCVAVNMMASLTSGTTYSLTSSATFQSDWTNSGVDRGANYASIANGDYILTCDVCINTLSSIQIHGRYYGGSGNTAQIKFEFITSDGQTTYNLGTITPTTNKEGASYTLNSFTQTIAANTEGHFKISAPNATSSKYAGLKDVTFTFSSGSCSSCKAITPTLSYASSVTVGGTLTPTLSGNTGNGTVTYSIKSGSGATVNSSTGLLTATAAGSVTVQAAIAANGGYCAGTATSGTITINPAPAYTVTAQSNNESLGTVSGSTTITASPKSCVGYASPAYTVMGGSATVNQDGNTFTVSGMTANVTVTINFAEQAHDTYIDNVQSTSMDGNYCGSYTAPTITDKSQATSGTCEQVHYHFVGWVSAANKSNPTDANIVKAGTAMTASETTYYAVWAAEE